MIEGRLRSTFIRLAAALEYCTYPIGSDNSAERQDAKANIPRAMGLIPYWAKDSSFAFKTINAMSETAPEKPAFRDAIRLRRCLIPANGFYEWQRVGPREKQPYNFGMIDDSLFAFAALWDRWRDPRTRLLKRVRSSPPDPTH